MDALLEEIKILEDEKEQLKTQIEDLEIRVKQAEADSNFYRQGNKSLLKQIDKMKNCKNCKYFVDVDSLCQQGLYLGNRDFTECYERELAE